MSKPMIETVLGRVDPSRLGLILPHEHLCASSPGIWQAWPELFGGRVTFTDHVVSKLAEAKAEGVDTIVDLSPFDAGRDIRLIEEASRRSGVNVVACTGHWLDPALSMSARTAEELTTFFRHEIEDGIEGTGIRAGIIKVATDHDGITPFAENVLRAAARASLATGVPVTTHSYAPARAGEDQAAIFEQEGLDPARVCIGHCDDTADLGYLLDLAARGYTLGMDHLTRALLAPRGPDILSWERRAECIKSIIEAGHVQRIFLSNDWMFGYSMRATGTLETLEAQNPDGMLFLTRRVIPYLLEIGVSQTDIDVITRDNPRRFLSHD